VEAPAADLALESGATALDCFSVAGESRMSCCSFFSSCSNHRCDWRDLLIVAREPIHSALR